MVMKIMIAYLLQDPEIKGCKLGPLKNLGVQLHPLKGALHMLGHYCDRYYPQLQTSNLSEKTHVFSPGLLLCKKF